MKSNNFIFIIIGIFIIFYFIQKENKDVKEKFGNNFNGNLCHKNNLKDRFLCDNIKPFSPNNSFKSKKVNSLKDCQDLCIREKCKKYIINNSNKICYYQ